MKNKNSKCPFCNLETEIIIESENSFAIFDGFPVSEGHALIIPKHHCSNYFELTYEEQTDCIALMNEVKKRIKKIQS